jgi:3',5'-cyclic AMP phosphodiesterase CpdA
MRIAHISDLHLFSIEGVPLRRFLNKRITGYANLKLSRGQVHRSAYVRTLAREIARQRADHVIISGDLTNLALEPEFELARAVIENDLGLGPDDVSIVPGNHDLYTRGSVSSGRFARYFADYLRSDLPELAVQLGAGPFPVVKLRGPAAIIGLSSAVPRLPFVAAGRIGRSQEEALAHILEHPEVAKRTPVIALHHPADNPYPRLKGFLEGLRDAARLWSRVDHLSRALIVHGHLHRRVQSVVPTRAGQIHHVGATSASLHHAAEERMAGFNLYVIADDGTIGNVEAHVLDPDGSTFSPRAVPDRRAVRT